MDLIIYKARPRQKQFGIRTDEEDARIVEEFAKKNGMSKSQSVYCFFKAAIEEYKHVKPAHLLDSSWRNLNQ